MNKNKFDRKFDRLLSMMAGFIFAWVMFIVIPGAKTETTADAANKVEETIDAVGESGTVELLIAKEMVSGPYNTMSLMATTRSEVETFGESEESTETSISPETLSVETEETVGESIEPTSSVELIGETTEEAVEAETTEVEITYITDGADMSEVPLSDSTIDAILESCEKHKVPVPLALAVINTESNFTDGLWSDANCYGLMGLHAWYFDNIYTPEDNVRTGIEFLGELLEKHGDMIVALDVYANGHNTGEYTYQWYVMGYAYDWAEKTGAPLYL